MTEPTAFISYSWDDPGHKEWVRRFATDLRQAGVNVILDQWEVRLGDDVTQFMEQAIGHAEFVLLVCTEAFATKAHTRRSGVGYEQAIVTAELLSSKTPRGRFVCVLRKGIPSAAIPVYMQSRLYVDLRDDQDYRTGLDQLLMHLFHKYPQPSVGVSAAAANGTTTSPKVNSQPRSWVLVAGTGVPSKFTSELRAVSVQLGHGLAREGFGLVTGGWPGVDEAVARAFADELSARDIPLEDRLIQTVVETEEPPFPAGQLVFVKEGDEEWDGPIRKSDGVVLVGGLGGTYTTGKLAAQMHKPVLPLADTGGDARKFYLNTLKAWNQMSWLGISSQEYNMLARPSTAAVDACIKLLQRFASQRLA